MKLAPVQRILLTLLFIMTFAAPAHAQGAFSDYKTALDLMQSSAKSPYSGAAERFGNSISDAMTARSKKEGSAPSLKVSLDPGGEGPYTPYFLRAYALLKYAQKEAPPDQRPAKLQDAIKTFGAYLRDYTGLTGSKDAPPAQARYFLALALANAGDKLHAEEQLRSALKLVNNQQTLPQQVDLRGIVPEDQKLFTDRDSLLTAIRAKLPDGPEIGLPPTTVLGTDGSRFLYLPYQSSAGTVPIAVSWYGSQQRSGTTPMATINSAPAELKPVTDDSTQWRLDYKLSFDRLEQQTLKISATAGGKSAEASLTVVPVVVPPPLVDALTKAGPAAP